MLYSSIKKGALASVLALTFSSVSYAADLARTLQTNADENSDPENFFEIGIGAGAYVGSMFRDENGKDLGAGVHLRGSYNWNGFFIDLLGETSDPYVLGYNAYNQDNWSFDVIFSGTGAGLSKQKNETRFDGINDREKNSMLGGRLTGYLGENILQLTVKHDVSDKSNGSVASALIGRNWQIRNWNFHGFAGFTIRDANFNDYYLGVSEEEAARTNFEAYKGETSTHFNSSVGATYPITKDWVFRATAYAGTNFGDNDSPLFSKKRDYYASLRLSISYVF